MYKKGKYCTCTCTYTRPRFFGPHRFEVLFYIYVCTHAHIAAVREYTYTLFGTPLPHTHANDVDVNQTIAPLKLCNHCSPASSSHSAYVHTHSTHRHSPQSVTSNGILGSCDTAATCAFNYVSSLTPYLFSVTPTTATAGAVLLLTGSGFLPGSPAAHTVTLNGSVCNVTSATSTQVRTRYNTYCIFINELLQQCAPPLFAVYVCALVIAVELRTQQQCCGHVPASRHRGEREGSST